MHMNFYGSASTWSFSAKDFKVHFPVGVSDSAYNEESHMLTDSLAKKEAINLLLTQKAI